MYEKNVNDTLAEQKRLLEKTGTRLIIFWFIVGFVLGALIF